MTAYFAQVHQDQSNWVDLGWENSSPGFNLPWRMLVVRSSDNYSRGASGTFLVTGSSTASDYMQELRADVEGVLTGWGLALSDVNIVYLNFPHPG